MLAPPRNGASAFGGGLWLDGAAYGATHSAPRDEPLLDTLRRGRAGAPASLAVPTLLRAPVPTSAPPAPSGGAAAGPPPRVPTAPIVIPTPTVCHVEPVAVDGERGAALGTSAPACLLQPQWGSASRRHVRLSPAPLLSASRSQFNLRNLDAANASSDDDAVPVPSPRARSHSPPAPLLRLSPWRRSGEAAFFAPEPSAAVVPTKTAAVTIITPPASPPPATRAPAASLASVAPAKPQPLQQPAPAPCHVIGFAPPPGARPPALDLAPAAAPAPARARTPRGGSASGLDAPATPPQPSSSVVHAHQHGSESELFGGFDDDVWDPVQVAHRHNAPSGGPARSLPLAPDASRLGVQHAAEAAAAAVDAARAAAAAARAAAARFAAQAAHEAAAAALANVPRQRRDSWYSDGDDLDGGPSDDDAADVADDAAAVREIYSTDGTVSVLAVAAMVAKRRSAVALAAAEQSEDDARWADTF